jgi:hypothetical protein
MEAFHCVVCNKNLGNSCSFAKHNKSVKHCLKAQSQPSDLLKRIAELQEENKQLKQMNMNLSETLVNITRISPVVTVEPITIEPKKVRPSPIVASSPVVEDEIDLIIKKLREEVKAEHNRSPEELQEIMLKKEAESNEIMLQEDAESHRRMLQCEADMEERRIKHRFEEECEIDEVEYTEEQLKQFSKVEEPLTEEEELRYEQKRLKQKREKEQLLLQIEQDERDAEESLQQFERDRLIRITKEQKELNEYKKQQKEQEKIEKKKEKEENKKKKQKPSKSKRTPDELELFETLKNKYEILTSGDVNCIMKYKMDDDIHKMVAIRIALSELRKEIQNLEDTNNDLKFIFEKQETDSELLATWKEKNHDMIKKYGL